MLEVKNVTLKYKKRTVLSNVELNAAYGQCIGLLGVNGSGKSTLLSAVAGAKELSEGDILLNGISVKKQAKQYRQLIGYVTQENPLIAELSAMDNLRLWTSLSKSEIEAQLSTPPLSILGVQHFLKTTVSKMSGGMKKRLSLASVLLNQPKILILDEPFAALDLVAKHDILDYLHYYVQNGGLVIIASHEESIFSFCSKVYLLHDKVLTDTASLPQGTSYIQLLRSQENQ